MEKLRKKALKKAKKEVKKELQKKDNLVIQAINSIEELDRQYNLLVEKTREWYSFYFPEAEQKIKNNDEFMDFVTETDSKDKLKKSDMGAEFSREDLKAVQSLAETGKQLKKEREELSEYVEKVTAEIAPNMSKIAGAMLSARLISAAGSLEKLAMFPASTIQVLGAEKALFSHLKKGTKPPKHGLIFQYPAIRNAKRKNRGKISRKLSNKLSVAAKADFFTKRDIAEELKKELELEISGIK